ncbi:GTPase HflX [Marinicrinis lubricantis]|uniref:GTPase HflX n=1 Tax=Marinicrinis lubricantis TaxID=2086470 RepID=A0ABW1ITH0_9BACL
MHEEHNRKEMERAILVSLITPEEEYSEVSLKELEQLAETAGVQVVAQTTQRRERPDAKWYVGKGKVNEIRELAAAHEAQVAIFDQELSGAQVRNLEEMLQMKIIDRTQLILDIFAQRARTKEGQLQVELAQHSYLLPRLSGHGKNLSRLGGGIGTRGPGESQLEIDRRHIRTRIRDIKRQLDQVRRHRELHRKRRQKTGIEQVALVGYTNAGKSTLLNQLAGADTYVQNQLFATLDPTSRALRLPSGKEILLTDTVGFIQNLPHDLVAAFKSTLEEVLEADLILHVVDASSPNKDTQIEVVQDVLQQLNAHTKDQLMIYNKMDLIDEGDFGLIPAGEGSLKVSALNPDDLEKIKLAIQDYFSSGLIGYRLPVHDGKLLSTAYRLGEVVKQVTEEDHTFVYVKPSKQEMEKNGYMLEAYKIDADSSAVSLGEESSQHGVE